MQRFKVRNYTLTFIVDGGRTVRVPVRAGSRGEAKVYAMESLRASNPARRVRYVARHGGK